MSRRLHREFTPLQIHQIRERAALGESVHDIWLALAPESNIHAVQNIITSEQPLAKKKHTRKKKKYYRKNKNVSKAAAHAARHTKAVSKRYARSNSRAGVFHTGLGTSDTAASKKPGKFEDLIPRPDPIVVR